MTLEPTLRAQQDAPKLRGDRELLKPQTAAPSHYDGQDSDGIFSAGKTDFENQESGLKLLLSELVPTEINRPVW